METAALIALALGFVGGQMTTVPVFAGVRVSLLDISVALLLFYSAYRQRKFLGWRNTRRFIPKLWAPILGFAAIALLSLSLTVGNVPLYVVGGGLLYIIRWIAYAAVYWVAASTLISSKVWTRFLVGSGIAIGLLGLIQYAWYPDLRNLYYLGWDPHYQRLFSTLLDPNFTGIIVALAALLLIGLAKKQIAPIVRIIGLGITLGSLVLTYSRSSIIAFFVGLIVWGILTKRTWLVAGIAAVLIGVVAVVPHTGEGRNLLRTVSSFARVENADRALNLIREKPLLGHGFNILRFVALERSWIDESVAPSKSAAGFDMSLLFVGSTTGIIGLMVYGWLLVSLFRLGSRDAMYLSSLTAICVHSLFINSVFYPWVMVWMWVSVGMLEQSIRADR